MDGVILGIAYGVADFLEFLRRAGLEDVESINLEESPLIEWRGGGPGVW